MKRALVVSGIEPERQSRLRAYLASFQAEGYEVAFFNYRKHHFNLLAPLNYILCKLLLRKVRTFKPDVVFVSKGESFPEGLIRQIRAEGAICANRTVDDVFGVHNPWLKIRNIAEYDLAFSFDKYCVEELRKRGIDAHYLPCCVDTNFYTPYPLEKKHDVTFVGTWYPDREQFLSELMKTSGIAIPIWGPNWHKATDPTVLPHIQQEQSFQESFVQLMSQSKITLNLLHKQSIESTNFRTFEATGCGTLLLTQYNSALDELFDLKDEIAVFSNVEEASERLKFFLNNEEERLRVAKNGRSRTVKDHTIHLRIKQVIREMDRVAQSRK